MHFLQMKNKPVHEKLSDDLWNKPDVEWKEVLDTVTKELCLGYVDILAHCDLDEEVQNDEVKGYAIDILSQGLLYMEFSDAIREGDGT